MIVVKQVSRGRLLLVSVALLAALMLAWGHGSSVLADNTGPRMSFNASGDGVSCDAASEPSACTVPLGGDFTLSVEARGAPAYVAIGSFVVYDQALKYHPAAMVSEEMVWADAGGLFVRSPDHPNGTEGFVKHGAYTSGTGPFPESTFEGTFLRLKLTCSETPQSLPVQLLSYSPQNANGSGFRLPDEALTAVPAKVVGQGSYDANRNGTPEPVDLADTLSINCAAVSTPTAGATEASATATPRIVSTGTGDTTGGDSNAGLWTMIGVLAAAGAASLGLFGWRQLRTRP